MKVRQNILDNLFDVALTADHPWARLASCIVYKGKVISYGINRQKSHPFQAKYSRNPLSIYLHSEISCIKNALIKGFDIELLRRSSLYICRVKHDDTNSKKLVTAMARPCDGCARCIVDFEIKNVIYTTGENFAYEVM